MQKLQIFPCILTIIDKIDVHANLQIIINLCVCVWESVFLTLCLSVPPYKKPWSAVRRVCMRACACVCVRVCICVCTCLRKREKCVLRMVQLKRTITSIRELWSSNESSARIC